MQELVSSIAAYCDVEKSHLIFGLSPLSLNEVEPVNASNHFNKATYSVEVEGAKQRCSIDGNFNNFGESPAVPSKP